MSLSDPGPRGEEQMIPVQEAEQERRAKLTEQAMKREPLPMVHSAWEGDDRTETAYLDGWRSARDYYAMLIGKGWPHNDSCLTEGCVFHRGHVGDHVIGG